MGLLADLQNAEAFSAHRGPRCTMCYALKTMEADESKAMNEALANDKITSASLARVLLSNGYNVKAGAVARHRKAECAGATR